MSDPRTSEGPTDMTWPYNVKCHQCGSAYDALDEGETARHSHHGGDSGMPRAYLLRVIDDLQQERDRAIRTAVNCVDREAKPNPPAGSSEAGGLP